MWRTLIGRVLFISGLVSWGVLLVARFGFGYQELTMVSWYGAAIIIAMGLGPLMAPHLWSPRDKGGPG